MKLVNKDLLQIICRILIFIICCILTVLFFMIATKFTTFVLFFLTCLLGAGFLFGGIIYACAGNQWDLNWYYKALAYCGVVTPCSIFHVLERGDVIYFYLKKYTGNSDTPEVQKSESWIIQAKGKHYIQILEVETQETVNLLPKAFSDLFNAKICIYNTVVLGDKIIYSQL